ncbi:hypothetical protein EHS25_005169 [Saitozyma podzolica]|uniref:Uncharacterized protein n=1 Tax=Saitozyma podzolica TaxID=1890683 RepID=A0A427XYY4_9TREE|nr:hypothetical protein EHS25_005169 [Saitozyma podzolica]
MKLNSKLAKYFLAAAPVFISGVFAQDSSVPKEPIFLDGASTCGDIALPKFGDAATDWWVTSLCAVANSGKFLQGQVGNLLNTETLASATFGSFDLYDSNNNELTELGYYRTSCDLSFNADESWWPSGFSTAAANLFWPQTVLTIITWQAGEVSGAQTLQMISGKIITSSPAGSDDFWTATTRAPALPVIFQAKESPDNGQFRSGGWYTVLGSTGDQETGTLNWYGDQGGLVATFSDIQSSIESVYYPEGITSL